MISSNTATSALRLAHILTLAVLYQKGSAQFSPCPANATSCCQCITTPGCSWYYGPLEDDTERLPRCRPLTLVAERPESYAHHYLTPPGLVNVLDIPQRLNRPLNPHRNRLLKPQGAQLTVGLGMRRLVPIQVKALTRRIRLKVIGPRDAPEFTIMKADDLSCVNRFRVRERGGSDSAQPLRLRTRRFASIKQLNIDCWVSAPREVQNLNLVVDINKCYAGKKTIRVMLRSRVRGLKRTKVEIRSACSCPCQTEGGETVPGQEGLCPAEQDQQECVSGNQPELDHNACSGVNNYCQREENEPVCSAHGLCICAVCICNVLPRQSTPAVLPNGSQPIQQRYRGWYCQCDDTDCPWSLGAICGGPSRGVCECGRCRCLPSYTGEACEETISEGNCVDTHGLVCGNHGQCVDGRCVCDPHFMGVTCQVCQSCSSSCSSYRPCIECLLLPEMRGSSNCDGPCAGAHPNATFAAVDQLPESAQVCTFQANGCFHEYALSSSMSSGVSVFYKVTAACHEHED